jgi:PhnB protein
MHARLTPQAAPRRWLGTCRRGHPGRNGAVYLGGDDGELRGDFETLSAGGSVTMPREKQAWGDEAGALADRFGITWMVDVTR